MKKLTAGLIASLLLASSLPAQAERFGDRHERHFRPDRHEQRHYDRHDYRPSRHRHDSRPSGHRHGAAWGVLGAGLALGAIALAVESNRPPPAPVVVVPAAPPERMWYYCEPSRTYYPYVSSCSEGWRAVPVD